MADAKRAVDVLNAVRAGASDVYQQYVPQATLDNITDVGNPIINYQVVKNEFINALPNRIFEVVIWNRIWNNELSYIKKAAPLGSDVEEIYVNPATPNEYDMDNDFLTATQGFGSDPDVKAAFHRLNRKDVFRTRIYDNELELAFTSYEKLDTLIAGIINALYSGDNISEFNLFKTLVNNAISDKHITTVQIAAPTSETTAKTFVTTARELVYNFKFPSTQYNQYAAISGNAGETVTSFCDPDDVVFLVRTDVLAVTDVEVLARAFNMDKTNFLGRVIPIDNFVDPNTLGVICDRRFFVVYDHLRKFTTFYNSSRLEWRYFYHVWQTYSISPFANAVAIQAQVS